MQTLERIRPMRTVLDLPNEIEVVLKSFSNKETFILQAIINELFRLKGKPIPSETRREYHFTEKQIEGLKTGVEQAERGEFVPEEEMEAFFRNAEQIFKKAIAEQKKEQKLCTPPQVKELLNRINQFGGMSLETSNDYLKHSKEFKEDFSFKADL